MRFLTALLLTIAPLAATAGLAEWEIKTPGGSLISHTDPWIASHGTCLRNSAKIHVSHLEWWRYYPNAVVAGKARGGYFLYLERNQSVSYYQSNEEMNAALRDRNIGLHVAEPMTPGDGWRQVWGPILLERCKQPPIGLTPAETSGVQAACEEIRKRLAKP